MSNETPEATASVTPGPRPETTPAEPPDTEPGAAGVDGDDAASDAPRRRRRPGRRRGPGAAHPPMDRA